MASELDPWRWVGDVIAGLVKPAGLVKRGNTFTRQRSPELVARLVIERFRFNVPSLKQFALVLQIEVGDGKAKAFSKAEESHYTPVVNWNIGNLWSNAFMYVLPEVVPSAELAEQLRSHLTTHVLPAIERCSTLEGLMAWADEQNRRLGENFFSTSLAIALARLGKTDEARKYFREIPGDPALARRMAASYGITI